MSGPPGTTNTPIRAFTVDPSKAPHEQAVPLHNRWHPEIPVASTQKTGQIFRVECIEWTGGQVREVEYIHDAHDTFDGRIHSCHRC